MQMPTKQTENSILVSFSSYFYFLLYKCIKSHHFNFVSSEFSGVSFFW